MCIRDSGKGDKIKRNVMINKKEDGGLSIPHVQTFCQTLKMTWIKKILDVNNHASWKTLLLDDLNSYGGDKCFYMKKEGLKAISNKFNSFWSNLFCIWADIQQNEGDNATPDQVLSQPLWYNNEIKIAGIYIYLRRIG